MKPSSIFAFLTCLSVLACSSSNKIPISDHYDGERFFHRWGQDEKSFFTLLKWQLTADKKKWPIFVNNTKRPKLDLQLKPEQIAVTFVNHATVYIQHEGLGLLTDPVWSQRASPVSFAGPKRVREPGVAIDQLPYVHIVMISHNHYDHFDVKSLKKLDELYKPLFLVPLGDGKLLEGEGIKNYREMDWWQVHEISPTQKLTFFPVKHWSARGLWDRNKSLWGGYFLETGSRKILFSGDTGYCDIFSEMKKKYGKIDFSLIPIGAYEPRWFMKDAHLNPAEAVQAHKDLDSRNSMGIHFGTWQLTDEGYEDPVIELAQARKQNSVKDDEFFVLDVGETKVLD